MQYYVKVWIRMLLIEPFETIKRLLLLSVVIFSHFQKISAERKIYRPVNYQAFEET